MVSYSANENLCDSTVSFLSLLISISHDHIEIIVNAAGDLLFFRQREGPWIPTLKLLHKCEFFLSI